MTMPQYGVLHPDGRHSVQITGEPFSSRGAAGEEVRKCDLGDRFPDVKPGTRDAITGTPLEADGYCEFCLEPAGERKHAVVTRPGPGRWQRQP